MWEPGFYLGPQLLTQWPFLLSPVPSLMPSLAVVGNAAEHPPGHSQGSTCCSAASSYQLCRRASAAHSHPPEVLLCPGQPQLVTERGRGIKPSVSSQEKPLGMSHPPSRALSGLALALCPIPHPPTCHHRNWSQQMFYTPNSAFRQLATLAVQWRPKKMSQWSQMP